MITLKVSRKWPRPAYTVGTFSVNGTRWCETLEDRDRNLYDTMTENEIKSVKVYGQTAIPKGTYEVVLSKSPKFSERTWALKHGGLVPEILNVKGFSGIRIHPFNIAEESLGCIGLGENKVVGKILNSTKWYDKLMVEVLIPARNRNEKVILVIE